MKTYVNKKTYKNVQSSFIHNSKELETTQMFKKSNMDKQIWYIHTIVYYSALKNKKNKLLIHTTQIILKGMLNGRSLTQEYILYNSIYMKV